MIDVRKKSKSALIVVDVQIGVMSGAWDANRIINNISRSVERARNQGIPVIWVQHSDDELIHESSEWNLVPELTQNDGEMLIHKHFNLAFEKTGLNEGLISLGVNHIVLAGASTNWCIRATAYGALERGYDLTLVEDAHTTAPIELDGGRKIEAENIIHELNIAMKWLSYPDRANGVATAEKVNFTATAS
ncbi:MAG: isochorismatase family protein [Acidiphilium sp.]|nr:isochorismatase family protein [Acidiphilium sp.]MDD4936534.1 isochorismatase family protein [Acidiphilium sp.]